MPRSSGGKAASRRNNKRCVTPVAHKRTTRHRGRRDPLIGRIAVNDLSSALADFSKDFSGRVLLPTDTMWDDARRIHNGLVDKHPALIAQCAGPADIARAVRLARERSLEIAVRGGGHNVGGRATVEV